MTKRRWFELSALLMLVAVCTMGATRVMDGALFKDVVTFNKNVTFGSTIKSTVGAGAATSGATAVEYGDGILHKTVLTLNKSISITDSAGTGGYGSYKMYDFPDGAIEVLGTVSNLAVSSASGTTHGLAADSDGDFSLGTAACNAGSLASTEADLMASTSIAQLANTAGPVLGSSGAVGALDGTSSAKDLYLNVIFDDADSSGADTIATTGTVTVYWLNLGDY